MIRAYYSPMRRNVRALLGRWNGGSAGSPTVADPERVSQKAQSREVGGSRRNPVLKQSHWFP